MKEKIKQLKNDFFNEIEKISDLTALEKIEIKYLGRKAGELTKILRQLRDLPVTERQEIGVLANQLKKELAQTMTVIKEMEIVESLKETTSK